MFLKLTVSMVLLWVRYSTLQWFIVFMLYYAYFSFILRRANVLICRQMGNGLLSTMGVLEDTIRGFK